MLVTWLKHYVPRGIYGRAALILLLPVVVLQLVVTVIYAQGHFERVTVQMTDTVLRELDLVLALADDAPNRAAIPQAVAQGAGALEITVTPLPASEVPTADKRVWYDYSGRVLTQHLRQNLPKLLAVDLSDDQPVALFLARGGGPLKITFERRRISAANPHQLFVYTIFFGVLLSVVAFLYLRNQLRPIKRLARAADAFGRGRHIPYTPGGAVEVRAAGAAFVDMRARIERQIEQRTLMLSGVSHDLRTPLTRMRLELSMRDDADAGPLLQDVDDMQRMLDEFLNFAKGAAEGDPEAVEPYDLIATQVAQAKRAGRNVTLQEAEGDGSGPIMLRKTAIMRAVDNLISNAVRYGACAEVSVLYTDKTLRIRVEDDGPGIPDDQYEQATRPFSRLDSARNLDKGGSVGLGLAITSDIARAHGGVLRLGRSARLGGLRADIVIGRSAQE